jgi:hypothetical protein
MSKVLQFGVVNFKNMNNNCNKGRKEKEKDGNASNMFKNTVDRIYNMSQISNIVVCKESNS